MTTTTAALTALKLRLNLTVTDFDTLLNDLLQSATKRLYPFVQRELAMQTVTPTVDSYGEAVIVLSSLTTPVTEVSRVESYAGGAWYDVEDFVDHAGSLYVRGLGDDVTSLRIYGRGTYNLTASQTAATVPDHIEQAVYWYAMSEFYDYLASNKAKYNIYAQSTGARGVDNMRDEAEYYEQKANIFINDHATVFGA